MPILLNEVQLLIDGKDIHFLLTGSSARKLKRKGTNLLGGRARIRNLHPMIFTELGKHFKLHKALNIGLLPSIYFSDAPDEDLYYWRSTNGQEVDFILNDITAIEAKSKFKKMNVYFT